MKQMPLRWKVKEFLAQHDITPYRVMKESGLAQGTVYRLVNSKTTNLNTETLDRLLTSLSHLTGNRVGISDLIEYRPPAEETGRES
jgi:DNA-binding Xre family transcriptional regulator